MLIESEMCLMAGKILDEVQFETLMVCELLCGGSEGVELGFVAANLGQPQSQVRRHKPNGS